MEGQIQCSFPHVTDSKLSISVTFQAFVHKYYTLLIRTLYLLIPTPVLLLPFGSLLSQNNFFSIDIVVRMHT